MLFHLSHSTDSVDGGIATAVAGLIAAQQSSGLTPEWITADQFTPLHRDRELRQACLAQAPGLGHLHGLWRSPTRIASALASTGMSLVIAPHGMLDSGALAISRRRKQLVWHLWERRALRSARCLHALCPAEADAIRSLLPGAPIAVIPNGVTLPGTELCHAPLPPPPWADAIPSGEQVLLFLGRFHRKKGIEPLLSAWQTVAAAAERAGWWLAFVGYGDGGALERQVGTAHTRGELRRVLVHGPVFGADKAATLAGASAFVLASLSEGLPMAALEAMAHGLPCLLSPACNLQTSFTAGAALPVAPAAPDLVRVLEQLFAMSPGERAAMGAAGQALVSQQFSWQQVALQTRELYDWILGGGARPAFVEHD